MASRAEISLLRAARRGDARAQILLAKQYLFGGATLPRCMTTSLHWLVRAAQQGEAEAYQLIGRHIPFEVAVRAAERRALSEWYARAADEGIAQAGLVVAKLVFSTDPEQHDPVMWAKAWQALERAAERGFGEAQWLLAQQLEKRAANADDRAVAGHDDLHGSLQLAWTRRAAENGVAEARLKLADHAWRLADDAQYLHWALPLAQAVAAAASPRRSAALSLPAGDQALLSRCAQAMFRQRMHAPEAFALVAETAAQAGDKWAQFYLGLSLAGLDEAGIRTDGIGLPIHYRKSVYWLKAAAQQGIACGWYIAAQIYLKPTFAQRNVAAAEFYLRSAAEAGHADAQYELGKRLWRQRCRKRGHDIQALAWFEKAAAQGCPDAATAIAHFASAAIPASWAQRAALRSIAWDDPCLAARIQLAACFGMSEREALLLDVSRADHGHCLEIDIRDQQVRGKRRLLLVRTADERRLLEQVKAVLQGEDPRLRDSAYFRRRLYQLRSVLAVEKGRHEGSGSVPSAGAQSVSASRERIPLLRQWHAAEGPQPVR